MFVAAAPKRSEQMNCGDTANCFVCKHSAKARIHNMYMRKLCTLIDSKCGTVDLCTLTNEVQRYWDEVFGPHHVELKKAPWSRESIGRHIHYRLQAKLYAVTKAYEEEEDAERDEEPLTFRTHALRYGPEAGVEADAAETTMTTA